MSSSNLGGAGSVLFLLFTLPLVLAHETTSPGGSQGSTPETTLSTYVDNVTILPDQETVATDMPDHVTVQVPTPVSATLPARQPSLSTSHGRMLTYTATTGAQASAVMTTKTFSQVFTSERPTVITEGAVVVLPTSDAAAISSVSEPAVSEPALDATEGPVLSTAITVGPTADELTKATTSLQPTTKKFLTSASSTSIGLYAEADIVDSPTPAVSRAAPEPPTEPTAKPSSLVFTDSPISPWVDGKPLGPSIWLALITTSIPYTSGSTSPSVLIKNRDQPSMLWVIIVILLVVVICVGGVLCFFLLIRRRKRSQVKHFGSKRRKGEEDNAWAGPVKLGGAGGREECNGEEGGKEEDGGTEGDADLVLSTFISNGMKREKPDGGVGVPGSKEAEKWEEETPLLYIDEDAAAETPEAAKTNNSKGEKEEERSEKVTGEEERQEGDGLKAIGETNGGANFCLTTAV